MVRLIAVAGSIAILGLSACATTPDPAEVCTSEWIGARADKAMAEFDREVRPMMRTLRKAGNNLESGKSLGSFQMLSVMNALNKLVGKFENSRALKDLNTLGQTCNDPDLTKQALTGFMRDKGAPDSLIRFLDNVEAFQKIGVP